MVRVSSALDGGGGCTKLYVGEHFIQLHTHAYTHPHTSARKNQPDADKVAFVSTGQCPVPTLDNALSSRKMSLRGREEGGRLLWNSLCYLCNFVCAEHGFKTEGFKHSQCLIHDLIKCGLFRTVGSIWQFQGMKHCATGYNMEGP